MKIMSPRRDPSIEASTSTATNPIQDLTLALQELLRLQQRRAPTPMQLDTLFQLQNFASQMNGDNLNSWLHNISTYFRTCREMTTYMKLYIVNMQLEGIAQTWWDTQLENSS
jgi:hypothetical protein